MIILKIYFRIFHGIESPNFKAIVWGRVRRFWRCNLQVSLYTIMCFWGHCSFAHSRLILWASRCLLTRLMKFVSVCRSGGTHSAHALLPRGNAELFIPFPPSIPSFFFLFLLATISRVDRSRWCTSICDERGLKRFKKWILSSAASDVTGSTSTEWVFKLFADLMRV